MTYPELCDICTDAAAVIRHPDGTQRCADCRTNRRAARRVRRLPGTVVLLDPEGCECESCRPAPIGWRFV